MKKLLTLLITGAMLLSTCSITAYAEDTPIQLSKSNPETSIQAKYTTVGADYWNDVGWDDATIAVNVSWSKTEFVYNFGTEWNTTTHKYEEGSGWDGDNNFNVSVVNHSNCPVNVKLNNIDTADGLTLNFTDNKTSADLTSAISETDVNAHLNETAFDLTFEYDPTSYVDEPTNLFSFDVVISRIE